MYLNLAIDLLSNALNYVHVQYYCYILLHINLSRFFVCAVIMLYSALIFVINLTSEFEFHLSAYGREAALCSRVYIGMCQMEAWCAH